MKYLRSFLITAVLALLSLSVASASSVAKPVPLALFPAATVPALNVTQYLGKWYQVCDNWLVNATFEKNGVCVCATYSQRSDGKIKVFNQQRILTPTGPEKNITGYAYVPDSTQPGQLKVHFDVSPIDGQYWVYHLGPTAGPDNLYQYSIVSDQFKTSLYVLVRDVEEFYLKFHDEVMDKVTALGFVGFNAPIRTPQTGCPGVSASVAKL